MADDPADIDLDRFVAENVAPAVDAPAPRRGGPSGLVFIALALVLAIVVGAYVYLRRPPLRSPFRRREAFLAAGGASGVEG